jgi:aryl-alcohol dehydrogenase-like predicted oxidoreductase
MLTRQLGSTPLQLSVIGLGTWAIGGGEWKFGWGNQDEHEAIAAILRAVELGINWIDTAAVYGAGRSEELVAMALQQIPPAQRPLIATKCGRVAAPNGDIYGCLKRESVISECEASLRRLKIESIDLYQLHWPDPDADIEEAWQTLVDLRAQGKVRFIGVSNHSVSQMQRLQSISPIASLQPPYSMIARDVEEQSLVWCAQQQIGVICYSPMGKGLLSGAFSAARAASLASNDHRRNDPRFCSPQLEVNLTFVQTLQRIADGLGWTVADLAISWVLRRPEMTSAIVGARSPLQIEQTAAAGSRILSPAAVADIGQAISVRDQQLADLGAVVKARV